MLYYFLLGIIFIQWGLPLGDSIIELIATFFEVIKAKLGLCVAKYNFQIAEIIDKKKKPIEKQAIGFKIPEEESYEEEEEYE